MANGEITKTSSASTLENAAVEMANQAVTAAAVDTVGKDGVRPWGKEGALIEKAELDRLVHANSAAARLAIKDLMEHPGNYRGEATSDLRIDAKAAVALIKQDLSKPANLGVADKPLDTPKLPASSASQVRL